MAAQLVPLHHVSVADQKQQPQKNLSRCGYSSRLYLCFSDEDKTEQTLWNPRHYSQ